MVEVQHHGGCLQFIHTHLIISHLQIFIKQPQREPSHTWRLETLEQQVRSLFSTGLQGRGGDKRKKAQCTQICEVTVKREGQEVG